MQPDLQHANMSLLRRGQCAVAKLQAVRKLFTFVCCAAEGLLEGLLQRQKNDTIKLAVVGQPQYGTFTWISSLLFPAQLRRPSTVSQRCNTSA